MFIPQTSLSNLSECIKVIHKNCQEVMFNFTAKPVLIVIVIGLMGIVLMFNLKPNQTNNLNCWFVSKLTLKDLRVNKI